MNEIELISSLTATNSDITKIANNLGYITEKVESYQDSFDPKLIKRIPRSEEFEGAFAYAIAEEELTLSTRANRLKSFFDKASLAKNERGETSADVDFILVVGVERLIIFDSSDYRRRLDLSTDKMSRDNSKYLEKYLSLNRTTIQQKYSETPFGDIELESEFKSELFRFSISEDSTFAIRTRYLRGNILRYILTDAAVDSILMDIFADGKTLIDKKDEKNRELLASITDTLVLRQMLVRILEGRFGYEESEAIDAIKNVGLGNTLDSALKGVIQIDSAAEEELATSSKVIQLSLFDELEVINKDEEQIDELRNGVESYVESHYGGDLYVGDIASAATRIEQQMTPELWGKLWHLTSSENFDFDLADVTPSTIGEQYEQTMSSELVFNKDKNDWEYEKSNDDQKSKGAFYTQSKLTDYILEISLGKKLSEISDKIKVSSDTKKKDLLRSVLKLKVADITSGGGTFLAGAVRYFGKWYTQMEEIPDVADILHSITHMKSALEFQQYAVKHIIYGLDMDLKALIVSSFALDLESLGDSPSKLPDLLGKTLIHQNSLIDTIPERQKYDWLLLKKDEIKLLVFEREKFLDNRENSFLELRDELQRYFLDVLSSEIGMIGKLKRTSTDKISVTEDQVRKEIERKKISTLMFNIPEVFFDTEGNYVGGFDIIFGNPPYIQLQRAEDDLGFSDIERGLFQYNGGFNAYEPSGNVYTLFFERGLSLLKDNGLIAFVTSNTYLRSAFGQSFRNHILNNFNPILLVNLGGGMFNATVDTSILSIQKSTNVNCFKAVDLTNRGTSVSDRLTEINDYVTQYSIRQNYRNKERWAILSGAEQSIISKIEDIGEPLKNWDVRINYGIKTGLNDAFIISEDTRSRLVEVDAKSDDIIRPILRGKDISKNQINFRGYYLINTHNGYITDSGETIEPINIDDYPAVKKWLSSEQWNTKPEKGTSLERLAQRSDQGITPFNLRDATYLDDFNKPKIIYREISTEMNAVFTQEGYFINNKLYMIVGNDVSQFLSDYLNSNIFTKIVLSTANDTGGKGSDWLEKIKVPRIVSNKSYSNYDIYKLLKLTDEEIDFLESKE
ncbi:MAG: Eco57I restriction-modification methylase domain-containing protein [Lactobacillaceae bacterium]|jgi:methylase of polypeptide subunit release factors|nr:Eco57I restriction-modification methylase domain-containing protein [Lactobacillaceae bacterium]